MQQETGTVAKKVEDKHFGFIKRDGQEKDLFFHGNELKNTSFEELHEGDTVTFDVTQGTDGRTNATNVNKA